MEEISTQQKWADFPESLIRFRERWEQLLADTRAEYGSLVPESEDFGMGWQLDRLLWFLPLAEVLKVRATDSKALSSQGFCFDHFSLCLGPDRATTSGSSVICSAVGPNSFDVTASWRDYLQSDSEGKREVVRAGKKLLFEGTAEDTANYVVQMIESWRSLGPPLP